MGFQAAVSNAVTLLMMGAKWMLTAMLSWSFEEGQGCCLFMFPYHFTLFILPIAPSLVILKVPSQSANE